MLSRQYGGVAKRFASASAAQARSSAQDKTSVLNNGLTVSSIELNGATSQLVLAFRAGSRYQPANKQGLVHLVRNSIGRDSQEFPGLSLVWNTAANGGQLTASSNKDLLAIQIGVVRNNAPVALSILGQLGNNAFKPWDVEEVAAETIKRDQAKRCGNNIVLEQLHEAAFRNGPLSRSSYIQEHSISAKDLSAFAKERLISGEAVLVGVNVDHDELVHVASQQFPLREGSASQTAGSTYFGGDVRRDGKGAETYVAIAGEGASLKNTKDVAVQAVIAQIFARAAEKAGVEARVVNLNYQDGGLVGLQFSASNKNVNSHTKSLINAIRSAKVADLENAKKAAVNEVLSNAQTASSVALDRASQILAGAEVVTPSEFAEQIKSVSSDDVSKALKKVSSKLSLAAYGTPSLVPYADEL
ncbi:unnamed protein product [Caenorhabditis auriculariae]|uniref:Uncharacterized protein n=1 Tax=Caenorhabditis auriculariae TaxID=2777116 RepID=A0A8S1H4T4_9PELO|nr:unnamed protein product [Caenorhabditis auriculariae]